MRVLIIGGTNFMGPFVVAELAAHGHQVAVFHRGKTAASLPAGVVELLGDRTKLADYAGPLQGFAPDVVLDMMLLNAAEAQAVLDLFRGVARRVVAASSADVYRAYDRFRGVTPGPPDAAPLTEESPLREKLFPYRGESLRADDDPQKRLDQYDKILVEQVVVGGDAALPGTAVRLPAVFGPRDYQHRLWSYLKRMDDGRSHIILQAGFAHWQFGYGYVENMAHALALAVMDDRAAGRIYNAGQREAWTQVDLVHALAAQTGWSGEVLVAPAADLPADMRQDYDFAHDMHTDITRIERELGYAPVVETAVALQRTIAWERAHPPTAFADPFDYPVEDGIIARLSAGRA